MIDEIIIKRELDNQKLKSQTINYFDGKERRIMVLY